MITSTQKRFGLLAAFLAIVTIGLIVATYGSADDNEKVTAKDVIKSSEQTVDEAQTFARQKQQEYVDGIENEFSRLKGDLLRLQAKASQQVQGEINQFLSSLEKEQAEFAKKVIELQTEVDSDWENTKERLDLALTDLRDGYKNAIGRFDDSNTSADIQNSDSSTE